jgi:hypothetical protein
MGPCIVNIFQYISKKMQLYTIYLFLETAPNVSGGTSTATQLVNKFPAFYGTLIQKCSKPVFTPSQTNQAHAPIQLPEGPA